VLRAGKKLIENTKKGRQLNCRPNPFKADVSCFAGEFHNLCASRMTITRVMDITAS
jgi:hypothetical protein